MSSNGRCFDIGNATQRALSIWRKELQNNAGAKCMEEGQIAIDKALKHKIQCGNGSLMRVSPVGLVFHSNIEMALEYAAASFQITHPYPTTSEACKIYTKLIASTFSHVSKANLASLITCWPHEDPDLKSRLGKYDSMKTWQEVGDEQISSSGYVVHSLEASLWAFFTTDRSKAGALRAVNLGDDADTVGAINGGLAGAVYGKHCPKRGFGICKPRAWSMILSKVSSSLLQLAVDSGFQGKSSTEQSAIVEPINSTSS